jgi:hypothetical protein
LKVRLKEQLNKIQLVRSVWSNLEVWRWDFKGYPIPPPRNVKQKIVKAYGEQFNLKLLIETGTYLGDMIDATRKSFNEIYSIELSDSLYEKAKKRFSKFPHIQLLHGDSSLVLPTVLSSINQPCLFWLDAHYSGGITSKKILESPIIEEMSCIMQHPILDHVVLIDDARCFVGLGGYPSIDELRKLVSQYRPDWVLEVNNDIIRIHPQLSGSTQNRD